MLAPYSGPTANISKFLKSDKAELPSRKSKKNCDISAELYEIWQAAVEPVSSNHWQLNI